MRLIRMWAVFFDRDGMSVTASPQVRGDALTFVRDLDCRGCRAHLHQLVNQVVRGAVIVRFESDVVVDVNAGAGPLAEVERLRWQRI